MINNFILDGFIFKTSDVPCYRAGPFSCGRKCGRELKCTHHTCQLDCHYIPEDELVSNKVRGIIKICLSIWRNRKSTNYYFKKRQRVNVKNANEFVRNRDRKAATMNARSELVIRASAPSVCACPK